MPLGPKMGPPQGHMFCIDFYRENMKKSSCLKTRGLEPLTSTKFVQIMPLGPKMGHFGDHMFCIDSYWKKHETIFLSEA